MAGEHLKATSPWLDSVPDKLRFAPIQGDIKADVAVIGGGIAGVMAAWRLAESGLSVALLEKGHVAMGDTGFTTAFLTRVPDTSCVNIAKKHGIDFLRGVFSASREAQEYLRRIVREQGIKCGFVECPSYNCSYSHNDPLLRSEWQAVQKADDQAALVLGEEAASSGAPIKEAVRYNGEARFDVRRFIFGLLERDRAKRLMVFEESEVVGMDVGTEVKVKAAGGTVSAKKAVFTTGLPIHPFDELNRVLTHKITFALTASCLDGAPFSDSIFWDTYDPYFYFRRLDQDTIILGGADRGADAMPSRAHTPHDELKKFLEERFPGEYEITNVWSGSLFYSADGLPYAAPHSQHPDKLFVGCGFGGNGMVMGTMAGLILADLASGRGNKYAPLFSLTRTGATITQALKKEPENFHDGTKLITGSGKFEVAKVRDVHENSPHCAEVNGIKIAVFKIGDNYYAIDNRCSHHGGPLCHGIIKGTVIKCPWHGSEFDVTTGAVVKPPARTPQRAFPARVRGDSIEVQI